MCNFYEIKHPQKLFHNTLGSHEITPSIAIFILLLSWALILVNYKFKVFISNKTVERNTCSNLKVVAII